VKAGAALALLALAGCAAGPRQPPPAGPAIPAAWRAGAAETGPIEADWWRRFGDPALTALVDRALANNTDIATAVARVAEARSNELAARAALLPTLGAGVGVERSRSIGALGGAVVQNAAQPQVQVGWEVDLFGRLAALREAARAGVAASESDRDATRLAVAGAAASGYIGLRALDAQLETAKATLAARTEGLHFARRRAEAGYTSMLELRQAEAEYRATARVVPQTELAITRTEDALRVLTGDPPGPVARGLPLEKLAFPPIAARLPSTLLRRRPDIAAAEARLAATDAQLSAARAAFLPTLDLSGTASVAFSSALPDPVTLFTLGGSILAPLFEGGRLRAGVQGATARRDQAAIAYRATVIDAFREVEDSLAAVDRLERQEAELRAQRTALQEGLRLATNRYRAGYASYIEQLDAQRGLLSADLTLIQARSDRLSAMADLYRALGGGWGE
jgi:NodT family efflux transporter outer membrane factor (OMF) lipoprotein